MEERGKIVCKKADNKAFKLGENWYNLNDPVIPILEKMNKGDEVVVTYEKKGVSRYVSKLVSANAAQETSIESAPATGFRCEVCDKPLKDGKFKKCFMCNKSGAVKKETQKVEETAPVNHEKKEFQSYDNPTKTASIQRGNALNAAASVASSQQFTDPEVAKQFTLLLAEDFLMWLRAE
jgi:hypothetical protein